MKLPICLLLLMLIAVACGKRGDGDKAEALYAQADSAFKGRDAVLALLLIDSLRTAYPKAFEVRQKGLDLKHQVIIAAAQWDIAEADSVRMILEQELTKVQAVSKDARRIRLLQDSIVRLQRKADKAYAKARFYAKHSRR
jgi:signal recognition particle receptor subunit beta